MKSRMILLISLGLTFICVSAIAARATGTKISKQTSASTAQDNTKATDHQLMGTVTSVTPSEVVVDHELKGKEVKTTFMLNSNTKKEGTLEKGSRATIVYRIENKQRVATDVKVSVSKPEAKKS